MPYRGCCRQRRQLGLYNLDIGTEALLGEGPSTMSFSVLFPEVGPRDQAARNRRAWLPRIGILVPSSKARVQFTCRWSGVHCVRSSKRVRALHDRCASRYLGVVGFFWLGTRKNPDLSVGGLNLCHFPCRLGSAGTGKSWLPDSNNRPAKQQIGRLP